MTSSKNVDESMSSGGQGAKAANLPPAKPAAAKDPKGVIVCGPAPTSITLCGPTPNN